jgi:hypothetical protein
VVDRRARASTRLTSTTVKAVELLFVALFALQCLDWYTTLTAGATQAESNPLLLALAQWLSPHWALASVKAVGTFLIGTLAYAWTRARGRYATEFLSCLVLVTGVYASVVFNNLVNH